MITYTNAVPNCFSLVRKPICHYNYLSISGRYTQDKETKRHTNYEVRQNYPWQRKYTPRQHVLPSSFHWKLRSFPSLGCVYGEVGVGVTSEPRQDRPWPLKIDAWAREPFNEGSWERLRALNNRRMSTTHRCEKLRISVNNTALVLFQRTFSIQYGSENSVSQNRPNKAFQALSYFIHSSEMFCMWTWKYDKWWIQLTLWKMYYVFH